MSRHPLNLSLRFLLEIAALVVVGAWAFSKAPDRLAGFLAASLMVALFAALWGIFAVPDDPSRSGRTVVPTPGPVRLLLELSLFGAATWMLSDLGFNTLYISLAAIVSVHYALSWDRIAWLLKRK